MLHTCEIKLKKAIYTSAVDHENKSLDRYDYLFRSTWATIKYTYADLDLLVARLDVSDGVERGLGEHLVDLAVRLHHGYIDFMVFSSGCAIIKQP